MASFHALTRKDIRALRLPIALALAFLPPGAALAGDDAGRQTCSLTASGSIGFYFDPFFTRTQIKNPIIGHPFKAWVALRGTANIRSWEASVNLVLDPSSTITILGATLKPPGSVNHGAMNNWIVDLPGCTLPGGDSLMVVEYDLRVDQLGCSSGLPSSFELRGSAPSRFSPSAPGWFNCAGSGTPFASVRDGLIGGCETSGRAPYFLSQPNGSPTGGTAPLTVNFSGYAFDDDTPQDQLQYYWFFDDGGFATGPSPQHTYTQPGSYLAWLNVSDGSNDQSATIPINVTASNGVDPRDIPSTLRLHAAVPVPFNRSTRLAFDLPQAGEVTLRVHDASGRLVTTILSEWRPAGKHVASWDGLDAAGRPLPAGLYMASLGAGGRRQSVRLVLIK